MSINVNDPTAPEMLSRKRALNLEELALLELYQRQDAMSTQLWHHFLLANVAVVGMVALVAAKFPTGGTAWEMGAFILLVWGAFTWAGLSAILNVQKVLAVVGHQIEADVGDKTALFSGVTRERRHILAFHAAVDIGIFVLCVMLISGRT